MVRGKRVENKGKHVRYNEINVFLSGCTFVNNHISWDDIFECHTLRECSIYMIFGHLNNLEKQIHQK